MRVIPIPQLSDNYAYLVVDEGTREAGIVDCAEAAPVLAAVKREKANLTAILPTHHHYDHVGGNEDLLAALPGLAVYGADERIPGLTRTGRGRRRRHGRRPRCARHLHPRAHQRPHRLLLRGGQERLHRRHFVRRRLRPSLRGRRGDDDQIADEAACPTRRHPHLLRTRVHREEPALCPDPRAAQRCPEEEARLGARPDRGGRVHDADDDRPPRRRPIPSCAGRATSCAPR